MAYSFNWNPQDRLSDDEIIDYLRGIVPDYTDSRFHVGFGSDDGGRHICVYVEKPTPETNVWKDDFVGFDVTGWRVLRVGVPVGYISAFFSDKAAR
jgi:hypothetical protein